MSSKICFVFLLICYFNVLYAIELYAGSSRHKFELIPCLESPDCPVEQNSTCINNFRNFYECNVSKFCDYKIKTRVTKLNEPCDSESDCNIPFATCSNKKCVCQENRVPSFDLRNCAEPKNCTEKGYILSSINDECLNLTEAIGQSCKEDIQCSFNFKNSICEKGYCQCSKFYVFDVAKGSCIEKSGIGMSCEKDLDCGNKATLTCIRGKCKCKEELVESLGMCINDTQENKETKILSKKCNPGKCECLEELPYCTNAGKRIRKTVSTKFKAESKTKKGTSFELLLQYLPDLDTIWMLFGFFVVFVGQAYLLAAIYYTPIQERRYMRTTVYSAFHIFTIAGTFHILSYQDMLQRAISILILAITILLHYKDVKTVLGRAFARQEPIPPEEHNPANDVNDEIGRRRR